MYHILIAEDEARMRELLTDYFSARDYKVYGAADGNEALGALDNQSFDAVLLDIMMPGLDGFSVCRRIRKSSDVPVLFLTARSDEDDRLFGYELGADDYITKPFSLAVLYAKVNALIKRAKGSVLNDKIQISGIEIDLKRRSVLQSGNEIVLAPKEYDLLLCLIENKDRVLSREQLLRKVWGYDYFGDDRVVDTHIKKLRAALRDKACLIHTVIKAGYQFKEETDCVQKD